jgi:hypothetical protein
MNFYRYLQSNPGGNFLKDMPLCIIIQAPSAVVADKIAEANGVYFDGIMNRIDCECCNDRWHRAEEWNAEYEIGAEEIEDKYTKIIYASGVLKELL